MSGSQKPAALNITVMKMQYLYLVYIINIYHQWAKRFYPDYHKFTINGNSKV